MSDQRPNIRIYTDGGADPNPGPGGWGVVLIHPKKTRELKGGESHTTNNRMELTAAIEALQALTRPCVIDFFTDSEYLRKGITEWIDGWLAKGKFERGEVLNDDLWLRLLELTRDHDINWHWVKGHAGNKYNERADQLASDAIPRTVKREDPNKRRVYLRIAGPRRGRGAAGWAAAVAHEGQVEVLTGGHPDITSNHFALFATLEVLRQLPTDEPMQFFTNNSYLHDGITRWVAGWRKKNSWKKFAEEWQELDRIDQAGQIGWIIFDEESEPFRYTDLEHTAKAARAAVEESPPDA